jgi:glycerol-3-phosphate dehydrogenase
VLHADRAERPRALTIYGGKLTAYRVTAAMVMQKLERSLPRRKPAASSTDLPLGNERARAD